MLQLSIFFLSFFIFKVGNKVFLVLKCVKAKNMLF